jgi:hypothetical protein
MKAVLGMAGLLLVLAVVGLLARKQLAGPTPLPPAAPVAIDGAAQAAPALTAAPPANQVQQYKQLVDAALQQPAREAPDEVR